MTDTFKKGLLVTVLLAALGGGAGWAWRTSRLAEQERRAAEAFEPAKGALKAPEGPVDLDKTMRVMVALDQATKSSEDLDSWLMVLARQDYRGVDPRVLEARAKILDILQRLYARQVALEDQRALWDNSAQALMLFSVVGGEASALTVASGELKVDSEKAKALLDQRLEDRRREGELNQDFLEVQSELFAALLEYGQAYHGLLEEWERLCLIRDRAGLAAADGDWPAAEAAAREAVALAPQDTEAHLILAWALIEQGRPEDDAAIRSLLATFIEEHPDQSAPALLLMGVHQSHRGEVDAARLSLRQSAAEYPRQAQHLQEMDDPYRARAWLRSSQEGTMILERYRSTMSGSGYFSPDLQLARQHFERGQREEGTAKVLEHFSRRRAQKEWSWILSDLEFSLLVMGEDFRAIFPEEAYLDLIVEERLLGGGLSLAVDNRSDRELHNATLLLCVQVTDMHPRDYEVVVGGDTQPLVAGRSKTSFGNVEIKLAPMGEPRGVDDIVQTRAILVSNEAVSWVDTTKFKLDQAESGASPLGASNERAVEAVAAAALQVSEGLLKDSVEITLPKELATIGPHFTLQYQGELYAPESDIIENGQIQLRFDGIDILGGAPITLAVDGVPVDLQVAFVQGPEGWRVSTVERR